MKSPFSEAFNNVKVVVFMETVSLSDHFEQIMLTHDQLRQVTDSILQQLPHSEDGGFVVTTNEDHSYSFPDIPDSYSLKEIEDEKEH